MGRHSERTQQAVVVSENARRAAQAVTGEGLRIDVRELAVCYGDVAALRGVSLSAGPGEFVAVTGHSGAGKTTFINAIAGIVPLAAGQVDLGGESGSPRDPGAVAIIPQGNGLATVLTAYENVLAPLRARGHAPGEAATRATEALASVGLGESGSHLVEELSGGQQQRVAVARGLARGARILLADEPTSELDHDNRERVLDLMRAQARSGAIVIMTTHDPEAAERADRIVELDDGELVER